MALIGTLAGGFAPELSVDPRAIAGPEQKAAALAAVQAAAAECRKTRTAVEAARYELDELTAALRDAVDVRLARLVAQRQGVADREASAVNQGVRETASVAVTPPPNPKTVINPRWQELNVQLGDRKRQRVELLDKLTPAHPRVQALDLAIADVDAERNATPEMIAAAPDVAPFDKLPAPTVSEKDANAAAVAARREEAKRLDAEIAFAQEHSLGIEKKKELAESKFSNATKAARIAQQDQVAAAAQNSLIAMLPDTLPQPPGANPRTAISFSGMLALLAGALVARRARRDEPVFRSAAEVRQTLDLPVLGVIPFEPDQSPKESPICEPRWVRRSVLAAELWVAAAVLLVAVCAAIDSQFLVQLLADPLAACSQKFW